MWRSRSAASSPLPGSRGRGSRRSSTTSCTTRWPGSCMGRGSCRAGTCGSLACSTSTRSCTWTRGRSGARRDSTRRPTPVCSTMSGRCEACSGDGTIKIEMQFLPDVYVPCEVCHGARYNTDTLQVHYKGKTIADVLGMPIEEGAEFFAPVPAIHRHLKTLVDVGLGYVRLGQPAPTLSGGEAQRVKLASELQRRATGRTIYVLDEPTTGLHFEDIRKLLGVLTRLVETGNTVIVIEHNLDVIKTAAWVIDLGPEGGAGGGLVVASGPPEKIVAVEESYTGQFLRKLIDV